MNLNELNKMRAEKVLAMKDIVETRGAEMNEDSLAVVQGFKAEIADIDIKIKGQEELRSVAIANSKPAEVKAEVAQGNLGSEFRSYVSGEITYKELQKRAATITSDGANVVPEEFVRDLQEKILEYGMILGDASKMTTKDNGQVQIPTINDTASAGAWTGETGAYDVADFSTGSITMDAHKITTGIQVSEELLEDSFFNIEAYLSNAFATRLSRTIEAAIINGDGTAKPEGIVGDASTKTYTSAVSATVSISDIQKAIYELQPSARKAAKVYVSDDLMKDLSLEVDTTGRPLLQSQAGATPADPVRNFISGMEVIVNYELAVVAASSVSCIIGDPKAYMVRNVKGFEIKRDPYSDMSTGMVNFYASMRLDGKIVNVNDSFVKIVTAV